MDFTAARETALTLGRLFIRGDVTSIKRLMRVNTLFHPNKMAANFCNMPALFNSITVGRPAANPSPLPSAPRDIPQHFEFRGNNKSFDQWQQDRNCCAFLVLHNGGIAFEQYWNGTDGDDLRISWSMSKSILSLLLGALIDKGFIAASALNQDVAQIVPRLAGTSYAGATLRNVLHMASGVGFNEDYLDYNSDINRMGRVLAIGGSMDSFATSLKPNRAAGQYSQYISIDTHVIGMAIRALTDAEIAPLMATHIFEPLGLEAAPIYLTDHLGEPFVLGGLNLRTRDYARLGLMVAQGGIIDGHRVVSQDWIAASTAPTAPPPDPVTANTPDGDLRYGYQWWVPPNAQTGECFAIGIYGQYIYINPTLNTVIVMNSADANFKDGDGLVCQENIALFRTIAKELNDGT